MTIKFAGAQSTLAAHLASLCLFGGLMLSAAEVFAEEKLLSFQAVTPATAKPTQPARAVATQQVHSVSALEYGALPSRMASRAQGGHLNTGPSEHELRGIFKRAVEAAVTRSPQVQRSKSEQQASQSDSNSVMPLLASTSTGMRPWGLRRKNAGLRFSPWSIFTCRRW